MANGRNLWVWLECIGVVSGCCCKEVYTVNPEMLAFLNFSILTNMPLLASINFGVLK